MSRQNYTKSPSITQAPVLHLASKPRAHVCESMRTRLLLVAIGALLGFVLCTSYVTWLVASRLLHHPGSSSSLTNQNSLNDVTINSTVSNAVNDASIDTDKARTREPLYIGVFTLEPYLVTRARACAETWGSRHQGATLDIYAEVTSPEASVTRDMTVVPITGRKTKDTWHTEKSLLMLQQMCARHVERFDWLLRAVDDAYVDIARLKLLLQRLDKSKEILLGHPTLPIDDSSFEALSGREYCLGGPGLVFSSPLMKRVCPHIPTCIDRFSHLPADVAINKCVSEFTGVECTVLPKLHEFFVHSFEKNQLELLDDFSSRDATGITYHPLKQPWLMRALHHGIVARKINSNVQHLQQLMAHREVIENTLARERLTPNEHMNNKDPVQSSAHVTFVTSSGDEGYQAGTWPTHFRLSPSEKQAFSQATRLANSSLSWGHLQQCSALLSGVHITLPSNELHVVDMTCRHRVTDVMTLSRAVISRQLEDLYVKEKRSWKTGRQIVITLHAAIVDPRLKHFIFELRDAVVQFDKEIILNILYKENVNIDTHSADHILKDLASWANNHHINILAYNYDDKKISIYEAFQEALLKTSRDYPDATVLLTHLGASFNDGFLQRCASSVRQGHQAYAARADAHVHNTLHVHKQNNMTSSNHGVCIHMQDIVSYNFRNKRRQRKHLKSKSAINVNIAIDPDLWIS